MDTNNIILNYTGKRIGVTNETGNPILVLPSDGNARVEVRVTKVKSVGRIPVYEKVFDKVRGLPSSDDNLTKLYIVNRDVAQAVGNSRFDLLVPEEPMEKDGTLYYRKLINY